MRAGRSPGRRPCGDFGGAAASGVATDGARYTSQIDVPALHERDREITEGLHGGGACQQGMGLSTVCSKYGQRPRGGPRPAPSAPSAKPGARPHATRGTQADAPRPHASRRHAPRPHTPSTHEARTHEARTHDPPRAQSPDPDARPAPRTKPEARSPAARRSTPGRPEPGGVRLATKRAFGQRPLRSPGGFTERHGRPFSPAAIYRSVTSRPARRKAPQPPRADDATGSAVTQGHRAKSRETPAPGGGRARPARALARLPTGPQFGPVVDLPYTRCRAPW